MNEITIHGHIGGAPKFSQGRTTAVNFSVAVSDGFFDRSRGEWVNRPTVWHDVVAFGELPTTSMTLSPRAPWRRALWSR